MKKILFAVTIIMLSSASFGKDCMEDVKSYAKTAVKVGFFAGKIKQVDSYGLDRNSNLTYGVTTSKDIYFVQVYDDCSFLSISVEAPPQ
ncbi:MAG: hypothetical protein HON90_07185 [Halobacteriovoraceae bacterium]|jgi:hypothetical protein|nr:hypothetical protein [Halobacteriovoraceae bacterium]